MAPKKKTGGKKTKAVAQESAAMLWLMDISSFPKKDLLDLMGKFKEIAADKRTTGKGKKKVEIKSKDGGGDDKISKDEFCKYFTSTMKCDSPVQVEDLFRVFDTTGDGFLEFREFLMMMSVLYKGDANQKLELVFNVWDTDGGADGGLSREEFLMMLNSTLTFPEEMDEALQLKEKLRIVDEAFDKWDTNGDEILSLEEVKVALQNEAELVSKYFGQNLTAVDDLIR